VPVDARSADDGVRHQVDEAPTARDVKERTFAVLMALVPQAVQAGYPIPQELLDYAPIPEGLRESWKAQIAQAGQRQTPSPEQIKVIGAQQLEDAKHSHKLQQISAATSADMARESAQAESERAIDADKAAHKQAEILLQAQVKKHMETHTAGLEAKVHALQTAIETIAHHVQGSGDHRREVAMVEHTHQRGLEMAEHEARLRPAPKPGTKN
jgi:anti-sigma28 factor (negative regulator of flagellin synthesis)